MQPQEPLLPHQPGDQSVPVPPAAGQVINPLGAPATPPSQPVSNLADVTQEFKPPTSPLAVPAQQSVPAPDARVPAPNFGTTTGAPVPGPTLAVPTIMSASSMQDQASKRKHRFLPSKKLAIIVLVVLLLGGGGVGAYFGYYVPNKPANVWRTALTNTQKGYDTLSTYATSKKNIKGMSVDGSFKLSGFFDGSFSGQSDGKNGQLTGSISALGNKISYDVREIAVPNGNTPDIYFKLDGLQGVGSLVGNYVSDPTTSAQISKALNGLNDQWYFIDHSLFDEFAQGSNTTLQFSSADITEILNAIGNADKQYLFTNNAANMAIVVKQYVGKEKQDGLSVYHYKVGVDKANLNAYGKALCGNLTKTKLFKLFEGSSSADQDLIQECQNDLGLGNVDTTRTADAWVDLHTKLIHRIRFTDKSNSSNYTDIVQDYQGGSAFPFSIDTHSGSGDSAETATIDMKLDTKANTFSANANLSSGTGSDAENGTFKLNIAPSTQPVKIQAPTGAKTIIQLLDDLGIGNLISDSTSGNTDSVSDTTRKSDMANIQAQLATYGSNNTGFYPTLAELNNAGWRSTNMPNLDSTNLKDPAGASMQIMATPAAHAYAYQPAPANCNNTTVRCTSYILTAILDDGTRYTLQNE